MGYASMQGSKTGAEVLKYRYGGDFSRFAGGAPEVLYTGHGQAGKDTARGLEQRRFEQLGGAWRNCKQTKSGGCWQCAKQRVHGSS